MKNSSSSAAGEEPVVTSTKMDFYEVMGVERTATLDEIRKAYRVQAFKCHPDKNPSSSATREFQDLSRAYATLSSPRRRKWYDNEGEDAEEVSQSFLNAMDYWRSLYREVTVTDIEEFEHDYRFSEKERKDVIDNYVMFKGDMEKVLDWTVCSTEDDLERFCDIIDEAIHDKKKGGRNVKKYKKYKVTRKREAVASYKHEAEIAQKKGKKLGLGNDEDKLRAMILSRKQKFNTYLDELEDDILAHEEEKDISEVFSHADVSEESFLQTQANLISSAAANILDKKKTKKRKREK